MPEDSDKHHQGIGICLSGGGYRSTLFHAGALRRLAELGVLSNSNLHTVSSVSGGSIAGAFLATAFKWPLSNVPSTDEWNLQFANPLRKLTRQNIRTRAIIRGLFSRVTQVKALAKRYDHALGDAVLSLIFPVSSFCAPRICLSV